MSKNRLITAAAGSGKTTFLVKDALKYRNENILITTYTQANEIEIKKKMPLYQNLWVNIGSGSLPRA